MSAALKALAWKRAIVLFPICLTIALFLISARLDLRSAPLGLSLQVVAGALVFSGAAAAAISVLMTVVTRISRKLWRKSLSGITLFTLKRAVGGYTGAVLAEAIGELRGHSVIRLPLGADSGVVVGERILAVSIATAEVLGIVEVQDVEKSFCLCSISGRLRIDFWDELESRSRRGLGPPEGAVFQREVPAGFWDFVKRIIQHWRG